MRNTASILHLDLDAMFSAVEMRDKPSLIGKPVVVGGVRGRGVVATASYEARAYGVHSAMSTAEARRRLPSGAAFLGGRFAAYRMTSEAVMAVLSEVSPIVEQVSIDEAVVDLAANEDVDLSVAGVTALGEALKARVAEATGGVTASIGIASSRMLAKIGSDLNKPNGLTVVPPGQELAVLHPLPVTRIAGVGPATAERLRQVGVRTVADLASKSLHDLVTLFGKAHGNGLYHLARAEDDRPVVPYREAKSISAEETFERDLTDMAALTCEIESLAQRVVRRLRAANSSGRTVTLKVRRYDFTTLTRSVTLPHPTDDPTEITQIARRLLVQAGATGGIRLLGVGVSGLSDFVQQDLFTESVPVDEDMEAIDGAAAPSPGEEAGPATRLRIWHPGQDVRHDKYGPGWVWGSGLNRVTVRFEGPGTPPGPVRTFFSDDGALHPSEPPDWRRPQD